MSSVSHRLEVPALPFDEIWTALAPLRGFEVPSDETALIDLFGRVMWSCTAEPGDGDSGIVAQHFGGASALALTQGDTEARRAITALLAGEGRDANAALNRWESRWHIDRVLKLCAAAVELGIRFVVPGDPAWPRQLDDLGAHAPHGLWVRGHLQALELCQRSIGVVGSRTSTHYGEHVAGELAAGAVDRGYTVVSGGAYGIDARAHRATLASGGNTVAVLAGGADRLYPTGNRDLLERVITEGAVVTEVPCGQAPTRWRFLQRNRLIAALSQVTVIVEASARSGALNTANHALELGRSLGAVPGAITSATSVGCNRLIAEQKAELITGIEDVNSLWVATSRATDSLVVPLFEDVLEVQDSTAPEASRASANSTRVWDVLRPRKTLAVAELAQLTGMSAAEVRRSLVELQLEGLALEDEGGWRRGRSTAA